jgi:hypothetical protein
MKYEDLKESFKFKTQEGKSAWTYTADKKSKHIWAVSTESRVDSADWDCEDMLEYFNSGLWVIQDEDQLEEIPSVQEQAQEVPEAKTLRDELIIAVLPTVCAAFFFNKANPGPAWTDDIAEYTITIVDSVLKARKEQE